MVSYLNAFTLHYGQPSVRWGEVINIEGKGILASAASSTPLTFPSSSMRVSTASNEFRGEIGDALIYQIATSPDSEAADDNDTRLNE